MCVCVLRAFVRLCACMCLRGVCVLVAYHVTPNCSDSQSVSPCVLACCLVSLQGADWLWCGLPELPPC